MPGISTSINTRPDNRCWEVSIDSPLPNDQIARILEKGFEYVAGNWIVVDDEYVELIFAHREPLGCVLIIVYPVCKNRMVAAKAWANRCPATQ